jgi:hypothetical protein
MRLRAVRTPTTSQDAPAKKRLNRTAFAKVLRSELVFTGTLMVPTVVWDESKIGTVNSE